MDISYLIGKRVYHNAEHLIGVIEDIRENRVFVDFGFLSPSVFEFPSAFSSVLTFEDEEIQEMLHEIGSEEDFEHFRRAYLNAINHEIEYLKTGKGKKYRIVDGERLHTGNNYEYTFDTDAELHFPDSTVIKLWTGEEVVMGYIMSCEDFTVTIHSYDYLGETVNSIEFSAEPWQLLQALMDRLDEMHPKSNSMAYQIACQGHRQMDEMHRITLGQNAAFRKGTTEPITFIWGPPGTGKTYTLAKIALEAMEQGQRVLMLSYSNVSVDGALLRVARMADFPKGQIVRYGYPRTKELIDNKDLTSFQLVLQQNPDLAEEYSRLQEEKKSCRKKDPRRVEINKAIQKIRTKLLTKEKELVQNAAFVATTVTKATVDAAIYAQRFDTVIFDEASMAYVPQIVYAAGLAKSHFVCLGDFCQLPAIVQNHEDDRLTKDIFEYTGITGAVESGCGHKWLVMLNIQHRMHPEIASFVSQRMYNGLLESADDLYPSRQAIADCRPMQEEPMSMIDLSGMYSVCIRTMDQSRINLLSALIAIRVADQLVDSYDVGIISPYSAQSRFILAMVRDLQERNRKYAKIACATVHQFQGSEKEVIIYDAVDCYRMPFPGVLLTKMENNQANRLFNVALTRTQGKFILIANREYLFTKNISRKLIFTNMLSSLRAQEKFLYGDRIIEELEEYDPDRSPVLLEERDDSWEDYIADLRAARKQVVIDVPGMIDEDDDAMDELAEVLQELVEKEVKVRIRAEGSNMLPPQLDPFRENYNYVTNPVTIIDQKVIWYGEPLASADFFVGGEVLPTEYFPCIRFEGYYTARSLQAFLGM